jgi:hypothetical protein
VSFSLNYETLVSGLETSPKGRKPEVIHLADEPVAKIIQTHTDSASILDPGPSMTLVEVVVSGHQVTMSIKILWRPEYGVVYLNHVVQHLVERTIPAFVIASAHLGSGSTTGKSVTTALILTGQLEHFGVPTDFRGFL